MKRRQAQRWDGETGWIANWTRGTNGAEGSVTCRQTKACHSGVQSPRLSFSREMIRHASMQHSGHLGLAGAESDDRDGQARPRAAHSLARSELSFARPHPHPPITQSDTSLFTMSDPYARPTTPSPIPISSSPRRRTHREAEDDTVGPLSSSTSLLGSPPPSGRSYTPQHTRRLSIGRGGEMVALGCGDELTGCV